MVNLFKHNPTISVRNTPECGTHYVTSIRTHNSQRTEHKYILQRCSTLPTILPLIAVSCTEGQCSRYFYAFQCLFTQQQPWEQGPAIPRPLVPQSYRSIAVFVETRLLHAVLVWFVDPFFVLLPSTQPQKPATSIISLS